MVTEKDWYDSLNTPANVAWRRENLERLSSIAARWVEEGRMPEEAKSLSSTEKWAVILATRNHGLLGDPLRDFLNMDDWLQRWVLRELGLESFLNSRIATDRMKS